MPYKNKEKRTEAVRRHRGKGLQEGITEGGITEGITGQSVTAYPAIIRALIDPINRKKLEKIHQSLKEHKVLRDVRYGTSGPTFELIGDMLEATG